MKGSTGILFPKYSTWAILLLLPCASESAPTHIDLRVVTVKDLHPHCHIHRLPESVHSDIYSKHPQGGAMREETSSWGVNNAIKQT